MKLRGLVEEDFVNYKLPSMFLITPYCDFKCCTELGNNICQNLDIIKEPIVEIDTDKLIERYFQNPITGAIVFGGLEPIYKDYFEEVYNFIDKLRSDYGCFDPVVIYTGFYPEEIKEEIESLKRYKNIIIKFGRFIPNHEKHFDETLGVWLISDNQYAEKIS